MQYMCPLCRKPVSPSLYQKITGIWKERQKLLEKYSEQKAKLVNRLAQERKKLRRQTAKFQKERARLVRQAVERRTRRLEFKLRSLSRRQKEIEKRAEVKIQRATVLAHRKAEKLAANRLNRFKKELRASVRDQLRKERERGAREAQYKYIGLKRTFRSTLSQMRVKEKHIREQAKEITELQSQLERETTPQIEGLLSETTLIRELKRRFPEDKFQHPGKGGDVVHSLMRNEEQAGVIVYECKRVKHFSSGHMRQTADAKQKRKADFAILVTNAMRKGTQGFFTESGVIVVHPAGVLSFVGILRSQMIRIAEMKLGQRERDKAIKLTFEYLEGSEFANSMDGIIQESISLYEGLKDEVKRHVNGWKKRYSSYQRIHEQASTVKTTTQALLSGESEYKKLIQTHSLPALLALPELQESTSSREGAENMNLRERRPNEAQARADEKDQDASQH